MDRGSSAVRLVEPTGPHLTRGRRMIILLSPSPQFFQRHAACGPQPRPGADAVHLAFDQAVEITAGVGRKNLKLEAL